MRTGVPDATLVEPYEPPARAAAVQAALHLARRPRLSGLVSLTPDHPYAEDGSALNFWKPSFLLGSKTGGEAGLNFWGVNTGGHINVALAANPGKARVLDCRILSAGPITYRIYSGPGPAPAAQGEVTLIGRHLFLATPPDLTGRAMLVELWPTPASEVVGFFGCEIAALD